MIFLIIFRGVVSEGSAFWPQGDSKSKVAGRYRGNYQLRSPYFCRSIVSVWEIVKSSNSKYLLQTN